MNFEKLPDNLPIPENDGACDHLLGQFFPDIALSSTSDREINLSRLLDVNILFIYPMTGSPDTSLPTDWDAIPGARGCTPQACEFRNAYSEIKPYARIFGLSSQTTQYQLEAKTRLRLPFELLSDTDFLLRDALNLPTFTLEGIERYKRVTLIIKNNKIIKVFYPVFPPDKNAETVLAWLMKNTE